MADFRWALGRSLSAIYEELRLGPIERRYPFLRRSWLEALEQSGAASERSGWGPHHLVIEREGKPIAFMPAYLKMHSMGEFVFDHAIAEFSESRLGLPYYPKLVIAVPFTPATGPRILFDEGASAAQIAETMGFVAESLPRLSRELEVSSVHVLFPTKYEAELLEQGGWALRSGVQFQFHNTGFPAFEDFLGVMGSKRRAQIRRERRVLLERDDLSFEILTGPSLETVSPRLLYELYLTTVDKYVWGRRYLNEEFFRTVTRTMPEALHVVLVRRAGSSGDEGVIAGAFNLLGAEALYGRYWGTFEEVPFLHFETCLYRGIEETILRGLSRFEPGAGGEHKHGRGFVPTLTQSAHTFLDPRLEIAVRDYFRREAEAIKAQLDPKIS